MRKARAVRAHTWHRQGRVVSHRRRGGQGSWTLADRCPRCDGVANDVRSDRVQGQRRRLFSEPPNTLTQHNPACAGEPRREWGSAMGEQVYPRVCGGTKVQVRPALVNQGLSPRVRGNPGESSPHNLTQRSIPACAGEPLSHGYTTSMIAVYPRVCGGTVKAGQKAGYPRGLSPRVRGNPWAYEGFALQLGSIPACAGEPVGV